MLRLTSLLSLPVPVSINYWWNFGSLLGACLILQILRGLFLSLHFSPRVLFAFSRVVHLIQDVQFGWVIQGTHARGASIFFICLYLHLSRGLYFKSFKLHGPWLRGVRILLITIAAAFLGYVLPWGQISFYLKLGVRALLKNATSLIKISKTLILKEFFLIYFLCPMFFVWISI